MAGAGPRTRKDGSASAKVGSVEVLRPRMIGPAVPMRRQVQAMATGAASAERAARAPAARAAAASLREKAESAGQARAAFLAARKGEKGAAASAAQEAGARAMRAGAAAQFAKAQPKAAEPVAPRAPLKRWEPQSRRAVRDRHDRVMTKIWNAQKAHFAADPTHQALETASAKASAHAFKNFRDYKTGIAAKAKADAASDALYAHKDKLRAEWNAAHPKEAKLLVSAGAGERRAMLNEKRQGDAAMQRYRRKQAEIDKAEAPARAKAAAEAHARHTAERVAHEKQVADAHEAAAARAAARERENNARNAAAEKEQRAYVSKAREVIASHPTPKGHVAIYTKDNHAKGEAPRVVKTLHQAGDVVAHKPIEGSGKGYSITHKPTGLRLGHVDSAAAAKHVVNGFAAAPHHVAALNKIANGEDRTGMLGGSAAAHFNKLRAEGVQMASGGAKAAPAPKLAFGKMTSDNTFKAPKPGTIPITGKTAERIAKTERDASLAPGRTESARAYRQARAATGRAYRREAHEARIARATKQRAARDAAKTRTPMKPTTLEGVRDSVIRSHAAGNIAAAERKNAAYERRARAQDFARQAA